MIEVVNTFQNEETVWILAYVFDGRTGSPANATAITVTLSDPDGAAKVTAQPMTQYNDETGEYEYFYNLPVGAKAGWWRGLVKVVAGEGPLAKTTIGTFGFRLK